MTLRRVSVFSMPLVLAALLVCGRLRAQVQGDPPPSEDRPMSTMLVVGEELEYRVTYSFFTIGTIRFRINGREQRNDRTVYVAETWIESNPSLRWLTEVHIRFLGVMDRDVYSHSWKGFDSSRQYTLYRSMDFDYDRMKLFYQRGRLFPNGDSVMEAPDTVEISASSQDGMSIFFYAREYVRQKKVAVIPTFIENREEKMTMNFLNKKEAVEIDAVPYEVGVVYFNGRADFTGVFGLTGGFEGWFSDDEARVPIVARLKVILGSIKVELTGWNRYGWQPPRALP